VRACRWLVARVYGPKVSKMSKNENRRHPRLTLSPPRRPRSPLALARSPPTFYSLVIRTAATLASPSRPTFYSLVIRTAATLASPLAPRPAVSPPSNAPPFLRRCGLPSCHRSLPCRSFLRAAPPLPFSPPYPLPSVTAVPPYRRSYSAAPAAPYVPPSDVLPAVCCRRAALPPTLTVPRRLYTHTLLSARPSLR